jgi:hypothetical protein
MRGEARSERQQPAGIDVFPQRRNSRQAPPQGEIGDRARMVERHAVPAHHQRIGRILDDVGECTLQRRAVAHIERAHLHAYFARCPMDFFNAFRVAAARHWRARRREFEQAIGGGNAGACKPT